MIGLAVFLERCTETSHFPVEINTVFTHFFSIDVFGMADVSPSKKSVQGMAIAFERARRTIHLDFHMLEKAFCQHPDFSSRIFEEAFHKLLHKTTLEVYHTVSGILNDDSV